MIDNKEPTNLSAGGAELDNEGNEQRGGTPLGQSDGGPYPNPHSNQEPGGEHEFDGGQSDKAYYGGKQLGDRKLGDQPNAPSEEI